MGLGFGVGVVVLGLQGGSNSMPDWKKLQIFADGLEGAVELSGSGAVPFAEQSVVLAAQPGHLGSDRVGGELPAWA